MLETVLFMIAVANGLVEGLAKPLYDKLGWDHFSLMYVAWLAAGVLVFLTDANLFADYITEPLVGQVLTALVAGRGANFLNDLFNK